MASLAGQVWPYCAVPTLGNHEYWASQNDSFRVRRRRRERNFTLVVLLLFCDPSDEFRRPEHSLQRHMMWLVIARALSGPFGIWPSNYGRLGKKTGMDSVVKAVHDKETKLLACSLPTKANLVQSPAGSPDFRMWESCRTPFHSAPCSPQSPSSALKTSMLRAQISSRTCLERILFGSLYRVAFHKFASEVRRKSSLPVLVAILFGRQCELSTTLLYTPRGRGIGESALHIEVHVSFRHRFGTTVGILVRTFVFRDLHMQVLPLSSAPPPLSYDLQPHESAPVQYASYLKFIGAQIFRQILEIVLVCTILICTFTSGRVSVVMRVMSLYTAGSLTRGTDLSFRPARIIYEVSDETGTEQQRNDGARAPRKPWHHYSVRHTPHTKIPAREIFLRGSLGSNNEPQCWEGSTKAITLARSLNAPWGRGGVVVRLSPTTKANRVRFPVGSQVRILPDDAAGRWIFSVISPFPRPFNIALLNTRLTSPLSALRPRFKHAFGNGTIQRDFPTDCIHAGNCVRPETVRLLEAPACLGLSPEFEAEKSGSDKGDTATRIKCAMAAKRKALNWLVVFSWCCVYLWDFQLAAVRLGARNLSYKFYFYSKALFTLPRKVVSYSARTETAPRRVSFRPPPVSPPPPEQTRDRDSHESARASRRRRARTQLTSLSAGLPWHPTVEWLHPRTRWLPAPSMYYSILFFLFFPLASYLRKSDSIPGGCRMMPLVGGFSRSPASPALSFRRCFPLTSHFNRLSRPRCAQISSLARINSLAA
ncbi:hypothetical protein PR048_022081 [Dryococelus australis]|uniref:Uncharacterized protein n=1 Tax=Dryococelus australis TaxID=614101 RepID=A0ABQ9H092_9NEOP|nr:hypothetical protein PR048_022081 [Dryococelus australis]